MARLPEKVRPNNLARDFPRLVDRLVLADGDVELAKAVLDKLMIDERGGRQGFPVAVATELFRLRAHYGDLAGEHRDSAAGVDWARGARGLRLR